jgi:hypothetical protein
MFSSQFSENLCSFPRPGSPEYPTPLFDEIRPVGYSGEPGLGTEHGLLNLESPPQGGFLPSKCLTLVVCVVCAIGCVWCVCHWVAARARVWCVQLGRRTCPGRGIACAPPLGPEPPRSAPTPAVQKPSMFLFGKTISKKNRFGP